jgi:hypothetical protein
MAGVKGRSGANRRKIFSHAFRISLESKDGDLLPFFKELVQLPADRRTAVLLAAVRGGATAGQQEMSRTESSKTARAIDALLSGFDLD